MRGEPHSRPNAHSYTYAHTSAYAYANSGSHVQAYTPAYISADWTTFNDTFIAAVFAAYKSNWTAIIASLHPTFSTTIIATICSADKSNIRTDVNAIRPALIRALWSSYQLGYPRKRYISNSLGLGKTYTQNNNFTLLPNPP